MLIDAPTLRHTAHLLTVDADWLVAQTEWLARSVDDLNATGFQGEAAEAAVSRLHALAQPMAVPPEQMLRVAQVLSMTAGLQAELDAAVHRAVALADRVAEDTPLVTLLLRDLRTLGDVLDWTCARQIDLLCTPIPVEAPTRLSDTPDLDLAAVHELNMLSTPVTGHGDLQILEAADARMVVAVGDLESAQSVTTMVAGVGSSDPAGLPVHLDRARTVAAATGGAAVVWLGYPAPESVPHALAQEPARAAGAELQAFQRELARRFPHQRRIVVGHSYGSVVAGTAASRGGGLYADDLVLIGSPGAGVTHAGQLTLLGDHPRIHAMTNPSDPIGLTVTQGAGVHGPDPTSPGFGARVWPGDSSGNHGTYWEDPEFLARLRDLTDQKKPMASSE
ncbi:alpha/beta hydrolase [Corynebacterium comes]|uniref:DUF1023 domain-containing protein n=1 Tax=Corynebacterium comes TaxID=2675218 RepID=A0A6B8VJU5_9CORY|nr:alpha/beta hydrolase [Corynebacterium comes]QGU05652.1 hypothetical protein CETAM_12100 [Corynebacterium comes]